MQTNPVRLGLIVGLFIGIFHAFLAALFARGVAQPLMDFIFWAHFLKLHFAVQPFAPLRALLLVGLTFITGLTMGVIAALLWNLCSGRRSAS